MEVVPAAMVDVWKGINGGKDNANEELDNSFTRDLLTAYVKAEPEADETVRTWLEPKHPTVANPIPHPIGNPIGNSNPKPGQ